MGSWPQKDAKSRFHEFLNAALEKVPQVVTRRGVEIAVLVPIEEWRRLKSAARPSLKELLLSGPKFDVVLPKRARWQRRRPIDFTHRISSDPLSVGH
jgi:antitoxin Phd